MRSIRQQAFGGPEVLELTEVARPVPLPTEMLVRVRAVGVNPVEAVIRSGQFPLLGEPPFVLGWDVSGVVEDVEPGVTRFQPGDEVYGMPFFPRAASAYAEYVAAPSRQLARKPACLSHAEAAALPLAGLTAWQALVDTAQVAAGQRVLIHGAGGGVGHLAVQIAKARGAHVIGTASAAKHDLVASLGADELIDHRATDFAADVDGVDVVLDTIGGDIARRAAPRRLAGHDRGPSRYRSRRAHQGGGPPFRGLERGTRLPGPRGPCRSCRVGEAARAPSGDPGPGRGRQGARTPRIRQCHRQDRADGLTRPRSAVRRS